LFSIRICDGPAREPVPAGAPAARRLARKEPVIERTPVHSAAAPQPIGPYNQAIRSGGLIFCSGQVGLDPATGKLVEGGVDAQARQALANLAAVLDAAGSSFERVLKTTIFLADMSDFAAVNAVYADVAGPVPPARSTVAVAGLPAGARVEIDAIACA
jgi:2-iminobutanoate/2-iminopropanoate deaminase